MADPLARRGSSEMFTGPIIKPQVHGDLTCWMESQRWSYQRHSKSMLISASKALTAEILKLSTGQIGQWRLITGNCTLIKYLHNRYREEHICRLYNNEDEPDSPILIECIALGNLSTNFLEDINHPKAYFKKNLVRGLTRLINISNLFVPYYNMFLLV